MAASPRPLGVTIIGVVVMLNGFLGIIAGAHLLGWVHLLEIPASGDPQVTGWAEVIAGLVLLGVGIGLMSLQTWAWLLAVLAQGLAAVAGVWALIQHGFTGVTTVSAISLAVSVGVVAYLLLYRDSFGR